MCVLCTHHYAHFQLRNRNTFYRLHTLKWKTIFVIRDNVFLFLNVRIFSLLAEIKIFQYVCQGHSAFFYCLLSNFDILKLRVLGMEMVFRTNGVFLLCLCMSGLYHHFYNIRSFVHISNFTYFACKLGK